MKNFYDMIIILENEQAMSNKPRNGEERRRHFGVKGTGGGRTDDAVIYNNLKVDYDGDNSGEMIVWFKDNNDLENIIDETNEVVYGYRTVSGSWNFNYIFTVMLSDNPSKSYPPGPNGLPIGLPNSHGSGVVAIEIKDLEQRPEDRDEDDYKPDPDGHGYWDRYWSTGPGRDR